MFIKVSKFFIVTIILVCSIPASALTVSPARVELTADPGSVVSGTILLLNEESADRTFYLSAENFEASGETGTPSFVPGNDGLGSWISAENTVTLRGGETRKIPFTVTVPTDARAGGHFAAIFWGLTPPGGTGQSSVLIGARVGILVLLRVNGEITEDGGVIDFGIVDNQKTFNSLPVHFFYRFVNNGDDRLNPRGAITIRNMIGLRAASIDANAVQGNILPLSTRKFSVTWGPDKGPQPGFWNAVRYQWQHFALGYYTANISLTYGERGLAGSTQIPFWVMPWQLLIVIGVVLLLLIISIRVLSYRRRVLIERQHELEAKIHDLESKMGK